MTRYRPRHLSVSAVQLYVKCPAQYRQRYVERLVTPSNPYMLFGSTFHAALEAEHRGEDSERVLITTWNEKQSILDRANLGQMPSKTHALALLDEYKSRGLGGKIGVADLDRGLGRAEQIVQSGPRPDVSGPPGQRRCQRLAGGEDVAQSAQRREPLLVDDVEEHRQHGRHEVHRGDAPAGQHIDQVFGVGVTAVAGDEHPRAGQQGRDQFGHRNAFAI